jgi:hypothetical protein
MQSPQFIARSIAVASLLFALEAPGTMFADENDSPIKADEQVIFFPTVAHFDQQLDVWQVPIHGWIFEPEENDLIRNAVLRELRDEIEATDAASNELLQKRLRLFLVDNERSKEIAVRVAGGDHHLPPSGSDGHFAGTLALPRSTVEPALSDNCLAVRARTRPGDQREFHSTIYCLPPTGVSVVSDVDDTIKITNVGNRRELFANTFILPFRPVEGMPAIYERWARKGAHFHYVSASPWQLYPPLAEFIATEKFPAGDIQLKRFRMKDSGFRELFTDQFEYKISKIEPLLQSFPERRFILVGDSGEKDPEAYAELARRFPNQIARIYIRDVTNESATAMRYRQAFHNVPPEKWRLFKDAAELPEKLEAATSPPTTQ